MKGIILTGLFTALFSSSIFAEDIYDPSICSGSQITKKEFLSFFPAGAAQVDVPVRWVTSVRTRTVNTLTGATSWNDMTAKWIKKEFIDGKGVMNFYTSQPDYDTRSFLEARIQAHLFYGIIRTNDLIKLDANSPIPFRQNRTVLKSWAAENFPKYVLDKYSDATRVDATLITDDCAYFSDTFVWPQDNVTSTEVQVIVSAKFGTEY